MSGKETDDYGRKLERRKQKESKKERSKYENWKVQCRFQGDVFLLLLEKMTIIVIIYILLYKK